MRHGKRIATVSKSRGLWVEVDDIGNYRVINIMMGDVQILKVDVDEAEILKNALEDAMSCPPINQNEGK